MAPKSIFRQPGAQRFQLVHRSLRDPLIHDPDASRHVLKALEQQNGRKGKSRLQLEETISPDELARDRQRSNIGEAAQYDIFYDDTEYDYMQHLRPVGQREEGVEGFLIEAPVKKPSSQAKKKSANFLLPQETLPSSSELPLDYDSQQNIPSELSGLNPDMDPHLRQVLEALDNDAFVDDESDDGFFDNLILSGERDGDDVDDDKSSEELIVAPDESHKPQGSEWENMYARYKKKAETYTPSHPEVDSEDEDTMGELPTFASGPRSRRKASSEASGYSMSSSSMFRNDELKFLDERFDRIMEEYETNSDSSTPSSSNDAPELERSEDYLSFVVDKFLLSSNNSNERSSAVTSQNVDMLTSLRASLKDGFDKYSFSRNANSDDIEDLEEVENDEVGAQWDCETILSTYTNLENRPHAIKAREIKLRPRTQHQLNEATRTAREDKKGSHVYSNGDTNVAATLATHHHSSYRMDDETKEEKKQRKQACKQERRVRRVTKKAVIERYALEKSKQSKILGNNMTATRNLH